MNQKLKTLLKFLIFLSIGVFLIWLSVHKLSEKEIEDIGNALKRADYRWIILSMVIGILSHISRAIRWKMLLEPLGFKPKTSNAFFATMVGYLANLAVLRLGEVTRPSILTRYEKIPFTESFGTVVVERVVDTLTFFIIAFIVFLIQFDSAYTYLSQNLFPKLSEKYLHGSASTYISMTVVIAVAFLLFFFRRKIMGALGKKTKNFINGFIEGLKTIRRVKSPALFIGHSVFIWFIYYLTFHICFFALDETKNISIGIGLTSFLATTLSIMITPGGLGAFPIAMASVLLIYNIDYSIGTAMGWLIFLAQFVLILVVGLLSLILLPLMNKEPNQTTTS